MKYAEIENGRVRHVGDSPSMPVFPPGMISVVDVTLRNPMPKPGWTYDEGQDTFTPGTLIQPTIRKIGTGDFFDRFTDGEMEDLVDLARANRKAAAFLERLRITGQVDLDAARIQTAVNALELVGVLAPGRAEEILY